MIGKNDKLIKDLKKNFKFHFFEKKLIDFPYYRRIANKNWFQQTYFKNHKIKIKRILHYILCIKQTWYILMMKIWRKKIKINKYIKKRSKI